MPVKLIWADPEETILTIDIDGAWEWQDFYNTVCYVRTRAESMSSRLDVIVWRRSGAVMPHGTMTAHVFQAMRMMPNRFGMVALVTTNGLVRSMSQLIQKNLGHPPLKPIIVTSTHAEALRAILRCREESQTLYNG